MPKLKLYINGEWVESETSDYLPVMNPALDKAIAEVPLPTSKEVSDAVKVAKETFEKWRELPPPGSERSSMSYSEPQKKGVIARSSPKANDVTIPAGSSGIRCRLSVNFCPLFPDH